MLTAASRVPLLRGHVRYVATAIPQLFTYRSIDARIAYEDGTASAGQFLALVVANGPRFGGGFRIAPGASVNDGALDFLTVADGNVWRRAALFARVRFGTHTAESEVTRRLLRNVQIHFRSAPLMDLDGELVQSHSATVAVSCLPGALRVACDAR